MIGTLTYMLTLPYRLVVHPLDTLLGHPETFDRVPDTTPSSPPPYI